MRNNPQQALAYLEKQNPNVSKVLEEIKNNGGDAKELFYRKAQEMGVNPQKILEQLM